MATKKHPRRLPVTPNSQIRSALRQLFLRSRERGEAVKLQHNTCQVCGAKGSVAKGREVKIEVHHTDGGIDWDDLIQMVRTRLLQDPTKYACLCKACHDKQHPQRIAKEKTDE